MTQIERRLREAQFGERTGFPNADGRVNCVGLMTATGGANQAARGSGCSPPPAREGFKPPEIPELLYWFKVGLSDFAFAARLECPTSGSAASTASSDAPSRPFQPFWLLDGEMQVGQT